MPAARRWLEVARRSFRTMRKPSVPEFHSIQQTLPGNEWCAIIFNGINLLASTTLKLYAWQGYDEIQAFSHAHDPQAFVSDCTYWPLQFKAMLSFKWDHQGNNLVIQTIAMTLTFANNLVASICHLWNRLASKSYNNITLEAARQFFQDFADKCLAFIKNGRNSWNIRGHTRTSLQQHLTVRGQNFSKYELPTGANAVLNSSHDLVCF